LGRATKKQGKKLKRWKMNKKENSREIGEIGKTMKN
jgi:hypothetical protein